MSAISRPGRVARASSALVAWLLLSACAEPPIAVYPPQGAPFAQVAPAVAAVPPSSLAPAWGAPPLAPPLLGAAPVPLLLPGDVCTACRAVQRIGRLRNQAIDEASGLVASALHPGVLYTHNDSGDVPRFFAVDHGGGDLGSFLVGGALSLDWEDVARGPCGAGIGSCLYFGDIGDNLRIRPTGAVYRVPEPAQVVPGEQVIQAEAFPFRYPDGSRDAETLLVHPLTGVVTIVSKVKIGKSTIYEFPRPLVANQVVTLLPVGEVAPLDGSPRFTAGDVHPRGEGVLMRTYDRLWFYPMRPDQSVAQALTGRPCAVEVARESQGEAVAWEADGRGYVTISEGAGAALNGVSCWAAR